MTIELAFQAVTTLTVLGGFAFGAINYRDFRRKRQEEAAIAAVNAIAIQVAYDLRVILDAPDDGNVAARIAADPAFHRAAITAETNFEQLGFLVYKRIVPLSNVDEIVGGGVRHLWQLLRPWFEAERVRTGNLYLAEWFEWLDLQLRRYESKKVEPAPRAHADWRP